MPSEGAAGLHPHVHYIPAAANRFRVQVNRFDGRILHTPSRADDARRLAAQSAMLGAELHRARIEIAPFPAASVGLRDERRLGAWRVFIGEEKSLVHGWYPGLQPAGEM
jgi:hypothetical protein